MEDAHDPGPADAAARRGGVPGRRGDTRRQIIDAALSLIADRGFTATSVDDIATVAGVAKGSVYYNFGSKKELFEEIITGGVGHLTADLQAASAGLAGGPALEALVTELLCQVHDHPDFAKLITAEVFRIGRDWQESIRLVRDDSMGVFAEVVGRARPDLDAALVGASVFGATIVAGLEWLAFQPERSFDDVRAAVLAVTSGLLPA
jgi:AcrR family transcriptional regulator